MMVVPMNKMKMMTLICVMKREVVLATTKMQKAKEGKKEK